MSLQQFAALLDDSLNSVYNPAAKQLGAGMGGEEAYMSHPLSHYWISSSHNTYLAANQLTGESTLGAYAASLLQGCRCIEVDCWDGEEGSPAGNGQGEWGVEPVVTHGHTLCSKLLFSQVIPELGWAELSCTQTQLNAMQLNATDLL